MMGRKILSKLLVGLAIAALLLPGCLEEFGELNSVKSFKWNPEIGTPLVNSTFDFVDFLTNSESKSIIDIGEDGLITLRYVKNILSETADAIFTVPPQTYQNLIGAKGSELSSTPITTTLAFNREFQQTFRNDDNLDSIHFKQGSISVTVESNFKANGEYQISIPSLTKNGVPFQAHLSTTFSNSVANTSSSTDENLSGYSMDLSDGGNSQNTFNYAADVELRFNNQRILSTDRIIVTIGVSDVLFRGLYGTLSARELIAKPDTVLVDIMDNLGEDDPRFEFENPTIGLSLASSYGIDLQMLLSSFSTINVNGEIMHIEGEIVDDPPMVSGPTLDQVGEAIEADLVLTKQNSNVIEMFSTGPNLLIFQLDAILNPGTENRGFVLDSSRIDLDLGISLPLFGKVSNLALTNDYDFNGGDLQDVEKLIFKSETLNGFPMEISLQAYFLDEDDFIIDSLFTDLTNLLSAGIVDANGEVTEPETATFEIEMNTDRLQSLGAAVRMRVLTVLNTRNNQSAVKFLSTYFVDVKIGIQAEYNVEI